MSFIRPEVTRALIRWRDALIGGALVGLGLMWLGSAHGVMQVLALLLVALGVVLLVDGLGRGRFRSAGRGQGPGLVLIDEGEITYMGPLGGGALSLKELDRVLLDPTGRPPHWVLQVDGQAALHIPVNAEGAEALFDAFVSLPGMRTGPMLRQLQATARHPAVIWERQSQRPPHMRLH